MQIEGEGEGISPIKMFMYPHPYKKSSLRLQCAECSRQLLFRLRLERLTAEGCDRKRVAHFACLCGANYLRDTPTVCPSIVVEGAPCSVFAPDLGIYVGARHLTAKSLVAKK